MYSYKIFDKVNNECENLWKKFEENSKLTFFQNHSFISEVYKAEKNEIRIVFVFKNEEIISIFPLEIKKYFFLKILQWAGTSYSDFCNPIFSHDETDHIDQQSFRNLWNDILANIGKFDLIFFNNQLSKIDNAINPFINFFNTSKFSTVYQIILNKTFSNYKEEIKKKDKRHHYELHRTLIKKENLEKKYKISFKVFDSDNHRLDLEKLINIKKHILIKKGLNNNLNQSFIEIFKNLVNEKKIKFLILNLNIDQNDVAKCFGFVFKNTFYYHIPILSLEKFNKFKPGKILITQIINWCIENNIEKFDFGLGAEKYKKYFSNKEVSLHRYIKGYSKKGLIFYPFLKLYFNLKKI